MHVKAEPANLIPSLRYMKGKVFILLGNAKLALFRRFPGKTVT